MQEPDETRRTPASSDDAAQPVVATTVPARHGPPVLPELTRVLLDSMTEGVSLAAEDGTIAYTNAAEDRIFGYGPGELVGQHVSVQNAYPPEENARIVSEVIAELKRSGAWRGEWLNRRKDGSVFVTTSRISAVELGGRPHWLCVQDDVTEAKAAAAALEESQARLELATDAAELGIWDWDVPTGRMTYSARAKAICGFSPDQQVTYEDARRVTHPDDYPRTSAMARRALDPALRENTPYQYRVVRADGTVRWVQAHGEAVFAEVGGETRAVRYVGTLQDITERLRLEEADRTSQARLALAIEAGQMAVWEIDLATDEVATSPELNRLLGFPEDATPTAEEMRSRYYPGERERVQALAQAALARGERTIDAEYRYVWPDGVVRWLWLRAEATIDGDGKPSRAVGVIMDVTDRRQADDALRANAARLKLAQQAAGLGVWDWDIQSGAVEWSPEMYAILGLDPMRDSADASESWIGIVHPDDRESTEVASRRAATEGEPFGIDFRIIRPDSGELRWVRSHGVAVLDREGRPQRVVGINVDVTEERRREEELRSLAGNLQSTVEATEKERDRIYELSNDLFLIGGFDGFLKSINPAWERLLGYSREQLLNRPFIEIVHPDEHAELVHVLARMAEGEALQRFEDRLIRVDGGAVWVSWAAVPDGDRFYAVGRDVTRDKEREEALRQSQKMEAMGQLTGGVAHDFNNLLTPIVGSLDMLQRKGLGGEREQRLIAGAMQSAERAKTLVQRLLAFARRQPLQATAVDIAGLVTGMADLIGSTSGPQINVVVDARDDLPAAKADPNQLEMALLNLAVNARDAMPNGGTLRITATEERVGVGNPSKLRAGRFIRLSVADTGIGMDEATLARAVEPFFSTKGVGKGTGLGLSMAHGLASQLGGELTIQSRRGVGTNVELWLPISQAPAEAAAEAVEAVLPSAAAGTALLVDDEELVRMSTADMLSDLGYQVVEASSAEEALRLIREGLDPVLLVSDHLMPGMNGTDLARLIRSERPGVQILIVSGYAEAEGVEPDLPRLTKPFRNDELAAILTAPPVIAVTPTAEVTAFRNV